MACLEDRREALTGSDLEIYGRLTDQFELAWLARPEHPPNPSDYLPEPPNEPLFGLVLLQILKVELEYRSVRGELPTPDDVLGRYPSLRDDPESLVEVLAWGSRLDDSTSNGKRSGFDMANLAEKYPEMKDEVIRCRATLYRELDGKFPTDFVPEGYSLIRELRPGGMSRVALVWNIANGREEVLKVNDPLSGNRVEAVKRFEEEIRIASRLTGQVVPIYRSGSLGGHLYYTMPYLRGGSLRDRLDGGEMPLEQGVTVLRDMARAVDKLHTHQTDGRLTPIVHRDLKPANFLFPDRGNSDPRIADLGLAKLLDEAAGTGGFRSATGQSLGTPGYMAPEQILGVPGGVGPAADVHALGAILYELLTGRRPFEEPTPHATLIRTLGDDPVPPRLVAPKRASAGLSAVAMKALKKVPSDRYPSASALADDLDRWLNRIPVHAREPSLVERAWSVVRRYPVASTLAALFMSSLMVGAITSTSLWLRVSSQKARADKNALRRATTLGGLLERVDTALTRAGLTKQRSDILRTIAADLHEVVGENDGLGSVELGTALNHEAAALFLLGRPNDALKASDQAQAVFAALPPTYEASAGLAAAQQQSGRILAALDQPDAGRQLTEKAIARFRSLIDQNPDDADTRFRMARAVVNLGNFLVDSHPDRAAKQYREALDQFAFLRRASNEGPLYVEWDARTRSNLGLLLTKRKRNDEAIDLQKEAATLADRLVTTLPNEVSFLDVQATCMNNLGEALEQVGRFDEADAAFRDALAPYRKLAQRFPDETEFRWGIAMVQTNLAAIQIHRERWNEAVLLLTDAGSAFDALLKIIPDDPSLRANAEMQRKLLTEALSKLPSSK
jgi:serine/threonine protein kinase/tetratricopeptide (TPR) repeat protein